MKKVIKYTFLIVLVLTLVYAANYAYNAFPIISGYGAKSLCSCVYVADRSEALVIETELGTFPLSLGTFYIDKNDQSAYGEVFGMAVKKAIYREGLGCTLISTLSEEEVRAQDFILPDLISSPDSTQWPKFVEKDSLQLRGVKFDNLEQAVTNAFIEDQPEKLKNTRGVVVIQDGIMVMEKYADGFDKDTPQIGWSMTKSITNAMIGLLVRDGKLDVYKKAPIDQWNNENDQRSSITTDHLMRMSSGLYWEENYGAPSSATNMLFKSADMGGVAIQQSLESTPDSKWYYSSGTTNILSKIVRQAIGDQNYHSFIRNQLFNKLGTTSVVIEPDASGTYVGSSYMYATPRDWAKFGMLFLNDGVWNDERILPEGWVKYSSTPTNAAPRGQYGAQFWLNAGDKSNPENRVYPDAPVDLYSMNGYDGQRVFIIPSRNVVIVRMGLSKRGVFDFNKFLKEVLSALP